MSLTAGNSKLGLLIHSWNLPARKTCPGKTEICDELCYGKDGHFNWPSVQQSHHMNWQQSQYASFAGWMIGEIARLFVRVLRIHSTGDFYDAVYALKWLDVIRACPDVTFYVYTRSWRVPEIAPILRAMATEPNVVMWFSCDRETDEPLDHDMPRAWMMVNDEDIPPFPVDLVFRDYQKTVLRRVAGALVCPFDNGDKEQAKPTCSQCKICFRKEKYGYATFAEGQTTLA